MKYAVCDLEANGLLEPATKVHCLCFMDNKGMEYSYTNESIEKGLDKLRRYDYIVFHNGFGYDLPLLYKLYQWTPKAAHDTMIMSRLYEPDRKGGHSIEAYAKEYGMQKVGKDIEDWSVLTDEMLDRCKNDARVGYKVFEYYKELML